jgi:ankyrin repeat protein
MPLPKLPLDILLLIAPFLTDKDGELCFADFNSFLKVNCALYVHLNPKLWKAAVKSKPTSARVFKHFIRKNDLPKLKMFLELGADVETLLHVVYHGPGLRDVYRSATGPKHLSITPLEVASALANPPMARLFLQHGAKIVIHDRNRLTHSAIHFARSGEMVQLLLDHGASPNEPTVDRYMPLHHYAMQEDIEAMQVILSHGARVDIPAGFFWHTPLHEAAQRNVDSVKLLLEHGADSEARGSQWNTPLFEAVRAGRTDVVKLLVEYSPAGVTKKDAWGRTPLQSAVWYRKTGVVRLLQELGVTA